MNSIKILSTLLSFLLLLYIPAFGQGKLMLVGGGAEDDASDSPNWSNTPYRWAVDQTGNSKVAVIAFNESDLSDFLPNYFKALGATEAINLAINTKEQANSQAIYDQLMEYDLFFFKGGDQSRYYNTYKDTKVEEAIVDKFQEGGVIAGTSAGMAVLSEVIFTAESGSIFPDQILEDANHPDLILKNDFAGLLPGYIVDTHFMERGRFARLMGFMGHWLESTDEKMDGIGVDDQTALCIDEDLIATAYGNGAVSIYSLGDFSVENNRPVADSIYSAHLLHGKSYDLKSHQLLSDYENESSSSMMGEDMDYTVFLSGSAPISENQGLLTDLSTYINTPIVIIGSNNSSVTDSYYEHFINEGHTVYRVNSNSPGDACAEAALRNNIKSSQAFVFADNNATLLLSFFNGHPTGQTVREQLIKTGNTLAFLGEDSKYAGYSFVTNNTEDELNAFYGDLEFEEGLKLLQTTTVMPDTYDPNSTDFYENNTASVQYAMLENRLRFGLYLNRGSYVKLYQENGVNYLKSQGQYSSILMSNDSETGSLGTQPVNSSGDIRTVVGFNQMSYAFLGSQPYKVGTPTAQEQPNTEVELIGPSNIEADVNVEDHSITISWAYTGSGIDGFTIERSTNGNAFEEIGSSSASELSYIDNTVTLENSYQYRVSAFQGERQSCYSPNTALLSVTGLISENPWGLTFANPTQGDYFTLKGLKGRSFNIALYTVDGKQVYSNPEYREGELIPISGLQKGLYLMKVYHQEREASYKIVFGD